MFPSGVIWTKSFELFCPPERKKTVPPGAAGGFAFKSSSVLLLLCKYIFLLHRQAGMLTHKPCKELKLARADD